jgi:hypothetical protein
MKGSVRALSAATVAAALLFSLPAAAGAASKTTTCDGSLSPGSYHKVVVPEGGSCFLGDGPVTIRGGLFIEPGATFELGSEESTGSTGTISGGVHATDAASVQIHFATINGGIDARGGSGPFGGPLCFPDPVSGQLVCLTWDAIEDNRINGGVTVDGYDGFWFGFIRNHVNGSVNLNNNVQPDPDGNEYVTNTIHGGLHCAGNSPAPQVGDSGGLPNEVTGLKTGQCAGL